jgi:hypothetical protein
VTNPAFRREEELSSAPEDSAQKWEPNASSEHQRKANGESEDLSSPILR